MKIGLIDVDGHNFPNLPLMKLSAYHKAVGDVVKWYNPLFDSPPAKPLDRVYMSKVFTFTQDYEYCINAKEIIKSGTGYFYPGGGDPLAEEIEHIYPEYDLYNIKNTAYGFLTRGCPRNCEFCVVGEKEGLISHKVADLSEFWRGQKYIELMDPNLLACKNHLELLKQLIDSKAIVNINQGVDCRYLTQKNIELIKQIKVKTIHLAWDNYKDKDLVTTKLQMLKRQTGWDRRKCVVYVLVNFNSTFEEDLKRIYTLQEMEFWPYVMVFEKDKLPKGHRLKKLQRWVNNRTIWESVRTFDEYLVFKI